jgi:cytochrome c peroxidase
MGALYSAPLLNFYTGNFKAEGDNMKKKITLLSLLTVLTITFLSFNKSGDLSPYKTIYLNRLNDFKKQQIDLIKLVEQSQLNDSTDVEHIKRQIQVNRFGMKGLDFWLRYMEPISYKKINGPLPVEWETEVFEKFEKPYKREGAGLTLAWLYLDEDIVIKDTLLQLLKSSLEATEIYTTDSIISKLQDYHHFYLCNRLYLLNLAAIYTTGFECPDTKQIIPELQHMLGDVLKLYESFNVSFPATPLPPEYISLYHNTISFVNNQTVDYSRFDHFTFIRDYVNPLFQINQQCIRQYHVFSKSMIDYSLNKTANSIFDKTLYNGQNSKGIFLRVKDSSTLAEIDRLGKLLFFDPILSGNNSRSCASCHKPNECFTENINRTSLQFNHTELLARNTPSLINAPYNHLIMLDGKHISLQNQVVDVMINKDEMGADEKEILKKVLSCKEYKTAFKKLLKYTPQETEITLAHLSSAITLYYGKFSQGYAPFDEAINNNKIQDGAVREGFNLFMSKAQCGTCHFAPQFNGVKPPYIGSEFEVLGVPEDTTFRKLSPDKGRYNINPAYETENAFRTGSIRNAEHTAPYMHNGVFSTLNQVIDFYNDGGGAGKGLKVDNQTLSTDSLHLSSIEKTKLIVFIKSLSEKIAVEHPPARLPKSRIKVLNNRKVGGTY